MIVLQNASKRCLAVLTFVTALFGFGHTALGYSYFYPQVRYQNAQSLAMGGVTLPLTDEIMQNLMNNPAGLARYRNFQAEFLNLNIDMNNTTVANLGLPTLSQSSLSTFKSTVDANRNHLYSIGGSVSSAVSWDGIGVGMFVQQRMRAVSDGTKIYYDSVYQTIPTAGIGIPLARGVIRLGYSLQYINQTSGKSSANVSSSSIGYANGVSEGHAFSNNASINFVFPYTYLPSFSLMARNIMGLHYSSGSLLKHATNASGLPADEPMTVDAALSYMIRISGSVKTNWYFQLVDLTSAAHVPILNRFSTGVEVSLAKSFVVRGGFTGTDFSAGIGIRPDDSEFNLSLYHEPNPLAVGGSTDTRYLLQYVLKFKDQNKREREK